MKKQQRKKPATPFEWAIYRVELNHAIAREMIGNDAEKDLTYKNFYLLNCLIDMVADIATAIQILKKGKTK